MAARTRHRRRHSRRTTRIRRCLMLRVIRLDYPVDQSAIDASKRRIEDAIKAARAAGISEERIQAALAAGRQDGRAWAAVITDEIEPPRRHLGGRHERGK